MLVPLNATSSAKPASTVVGDRRPTRRLMFPPFPAGLAYGKARTRRCDGAGRTPARASWRSEHYADRPLIEVVVQRDRRLTRAKPRAEQKKVLPASARSFQVTEKRLRSASTTRWWRRLVACAADVATRASAGVTEGGADR